MINPPPQCGGGQGGGILLHRFFVATLCSLAFAVHASAATLDLETATILDLQKAYDAGLTSEKVVNAYLSKLPPTTPLIGVEKINY